MSFDSGADFAAKREEVEAERAAVRRSRRCARPRGSAPAPRDFVAALRARRPAIIAEIKRASPSKGDILPGLDPAAVAREYARCGRGGDLGADRRHFKGSLEDLRAVRAAVDLPLLRKDFIFDPLSALRGARGRRRLYPADRGDAARRPICARCTRSRASLGLQRWSKFITNDELRAAARDRRRTDRDQQSRPAYLRDRYRGHRAAAGGYRGAALIVSESGIDTPGRYPPARRAPARALF